MLDEVTNNFDFHAKAHVISVLKKYPGAMIVVSHDVDFLHQIRIEKFFEINNRFWRQRNGS